MIKNIEDGNGNFLPITFLQVPIKWLVYLTVYPIPEQLDLKYQIQQSLINNVIKRPRMLLDILWYHAF